MKVIAWIGLFIVIVIAIDFSNGYSKTIELKRELLKLEIEEKKLNIDLLRMVTESDPKLTPSEYLELQGATNGH